MDVVGGSYSGISVQWNLSITNRLYITKPHYSEQILPDLWSFVILKFHYINEPLVVWENVFINPLSPPICIQILYTDLLTFS